MNTPVLRPETNNAEAERELDAMAVERALWLAQLTAERAGFCCLAAEIFEVFAKAVELRCEIRGASSQS